MQQLPNATQCSTYAKAGRLAVRGTEQPPL